MEMHLLDRSKFGANLNLFKIKFIRFENRIEHTVLRGHVSAPRRAVAPHPDVAPLRCPTPRPSPLPPLSPPLRPTCRQAPRTPLHVRPAGPPYKRALPLAAGWDFSPPMLCFCPPLMPRPQPPPSPPPLATGPPRGHRHPTGDALPQERRRAGHFPPPTAARPPR
jgi:hypothetical protein